MSKHVLVRPAKKYRCNCGTGQFCRRHARYHFVPDISVKDPAIYQKCGGGYRIIRKKYPD